MRKTSQQQRKSIEDSLLNLIRLNQNQKNIKESDQEQKEQQIKESEEDDDIDLDSQEMRMAEQAFINIEPISPEIKKKKKKNKLFFVASEVNNELDQEDNQDTVNVDSKVTQKVKSILKNYQPNLHENKEKKTKRIKFEDADNKQYILHDMERRWDEKLPNAKKGKFDPHEKKQLIRSLAQCLNESNLSIQNIKQTLNEDGSRLPRNLKFWGKVCSVLADRTLLSSYKFLKRQLSPKNQSGEWSQEQTNKLIELVDKQGKKWSHIAKQMNRTAENIRDKYRSIINEQSQEFQKQMWKLEEIVELIRKIEQHIGQKSKKKLINPKISEQLLKSEQHDKVQVQELQRRSYNSKKFIFHNNSVVRNYLSEDFNQIKIEEIPWQNISETLKSRSPFECRNKILQLLMLNTKNSQSQQNIEKKIVNFIIKQNCKSENQINWGGWNQLTGVTIQEAKNRYMIFKRNIQGRGQKSFKDLIYLMKQRINSNQKK